MLLKRMRFKYTLVSLYQRCRFPGHRQGLQEAALAPNAANAGAVGSLSGAAASEDQVFLVLRAVHRHLRRAERVLPLHHSLLHLAGAALGGALDGALLNVMVGIM